MATFVHHVPIHPARQFTNFHENHQASRGPSRRLRRRLASRWRAQFWDPFGPFDGPADSRGAPTREAVDRPCCFQLGALGNVQTQTARAFTAAEMEKLLAMKSK